MSEDIIVKVQLPLAPFLPSNRWLAMIYDQQRSLMEQRMLTHQEKLMIKFKGVKIYCNATKNKAGNSWVLTSISRNQLRKW